MATFFQLLLCLLIIILAYVISYFLVRWRLKRTCISIVNILHEKNSNNEHNAVELLDDRFLKIGVKDYKPKALEILLSQEIIKKTSDGKYYLNDYDKFTLLFNKFTILFK